MKAIDEYHRAVEASDEDQVYIGRCEDKSAGIHSDAPDQVRPALGEVVQDVIDYFQRCSGELSARQTVPIVSAAPPFSPACSRSH